MKLNNKNIENHDNGTNTVAIHNEYGDDNNETTVVSIKEYRKMLNDYISTDDQIISRLKYLESLSREIIRKELKK